MPKISASALADIYASTPLDSASNYGFNLIPSEDDDALNADVANEQERRLRDFSRFQQGVFAYANSDRADYLSEDAAKIFGNNTLNPNARDTPYWLGCAALSYLGVDNIYNAYQAFDIPIPTDAADDAELTARFGASLIKNARTEYDKLKSLQDKTKLRISNNFAALLKGEKTPNDISLDEFAEISDAYGFNPFDIYYAGRVVEARQAQTTAGKLSSLAKATITTRAPFLSKVIDAANEAIHGNTQEAAKALITNRNQTDAFQQLDKAWTHPDTTNSLYTRLAFNPEHVMLIASRVQMGMQEKMLKEMNGFERVIYSAGESTINSMARGVMLPIKGYTDWATGNLRTYENKVDAMRMGASLDLADQQALANAQAAGHTSMLEEAATTAAAIIPYMNRYTALFSSIDLAHRNTSGHLLNRAGDIEREYFNEALAKGAAQSAITWGTRAVGYGMFSKVAAKVAPRLLNSTLGYYVSNAAITGANFATVVPFMDAALNHLWDETFTSHVELQTGGKQMHELVNNLQSLRYWGVQMIVGGILAGSSIYTHYNAKASRDALITYGKLQGLSDREANAIVATTPITQAPEAIIDALRDKIKNNPQQALADRVANLNAFLSEEQQQAAHTLGRSILADNARLATIQLNGFSVEVDPNDPNYVLITTDGHYDEATQSFKPGDKTTRMSMQDAEICLASIFGTQEAVTARAMRSALANGTMLDAAKKVFGDRLAIEAIAEPLSLDAAVKRGKDAESLQKERARALMDESKGEDRKPSLSESEALKRAAAEKAPTLHPTQTIAEMIQFGKNAEQRIAQAKALLGKDADKADFSTRAFVVTPKNADAASVKRILKIAEGASTREIAEEYAHMYLEDYIANTGTDYADTWRLLHALSTSIKGEDNFSLTTLQQTHPELAAKLTSENPASFDSLSVIDQDLVRHDVQEGFAALTLSDLRYRAQQGDVSLPDFARPLFDADLVMRSVMQNELATAAALNESRELGLFDENAQRLLRAPADAIAKALSEIQNPTPTQYYNAYQRASQFFGSALLDHTPEQTIADLDRWDALAKTPSTEPSPLEEAYEADTPPVEREAKQRALDEAIAEESALPENEGLTTEEVANKVARKVIEAKKRDTQDTDAHPDTEYDPSLGAYAYKAQDKTSKLPCRYAIISLDKLSIMPNFKIGSDETTGEVNELTGAFMPDHPPISVYHDPADGSLLVMSGRHRLAHARRCGMADIACYVYDKTPERDLVWAQKNDVEWNIRDEQASPTEIALYIRGELIPGVPALTSAEIAKNNIYARKNSKAEKGFIIGTKAIDDVIYALRDDAITEQQAFAIANTSSDPTVQRYGLRDAQNNVASRGIVINMSLHASRLEYLQARGEYRQADFFGEMQDHTDSVLQNYILTYAKERAAFYDKRIKAKNLEKIVVEDPNALGDSALRIDKALYKRNAKLKNKPTDPTLLRDMWLSVWQHMDVFGEEIDAAFKKDHPKEWQELQDRKAQQEAEQATLQETEAPDLGNEVQGDLSNIPTLFSTSATHLERWQAVPTAELGELGHFGDNIERKTSLLTGEGRAINAYNERIVRMNNALKRRLGELRHLKDSGKADSEEAIKLYAEMAAIYNQITHILPQGYRFGLEPYSIFFDTYADLWGKGDTKHAVANIPMGATWQRKMYAAFENQFERILTGELSTEHESAFFDLFNQFTFNADIQHLRNEYVRMRAEAIEEVNSRFDDHTTREYKRARTEALTKVYDTLKAENPAIFEALYKAVGELRAHRLMDKFLARVTLKLDQFRKDITLSSITKAINRLTPRHEKNGKPIKGTVDPTTYNTALTNYRLLLLTPGQKEAIDTANESALLETAAPNAIIKVTTFDTDGKEITFEVSKQQYETYACFEDMSPEYAETAAAAMGTLIKNGKEAWQLAQEQAKKAVEDFCAPALDTYQETDPERQTRQENEALYHIASGSRLVNYTVGLLNDVQLFNYIANHQGLQSFYAISEKVARAHTYLEQSEYETTTHAREVVEKIIGSSKRKDIARWIDHINTNKECNIELVRQAPDFTAKHTASLRDSLFKRLFTYVHRTKNFNANRFAAALHMLLESNTLPPQIAAEVKAKYGNIGDRDKYRGEPISAFQQLFTADKFGHLRNFNKAVKERAAESLKKYNEDLENKKISRKPQLIKDISPNVASYLILMAEQSDFAENMRLQGYTPEVLRQLRDIAGEDMMQFAYALRTLLNERTPQLKEIYEATYGTPFPQVENYFRAFFDVRNQESMDGFLSGMAYGHGKADGAITIFRTRVKHNAAVSRVMSTTGAFLVGMKQQDNIIAYSDPNTHIHLATLLRQAQSYTDSSGQTFEQALKKALGENVVNALEMQTDNMMRLFGYNEKEGKSLTKFASDFAKASAVSILNGRVSSLAKNIMAILNTLGGSEKAGAADWLLSVYRAWLGYSIMSREEMAQQNFIKYRYKGYSFDTDKESIFSLTRQKNEHSTNPIARYLLTLFGKFDRWASTIAATALYDAHYRAVQRENPDLPHEVIRAEALSITERALYQKGQPMDWRSRALNASRMSWRTIGLYFLGGEAVNTFGNCITLIGMASTTIRQEGFTPKASRQLNNAISAWLFSGALMSLLNWGYYSITDDEETWKKRGFVSHMFWGSMLGPISGIPLISDLASLAVEGGHTLAGYKAPYLANSALLPLGDLRRACNEIPHIWNSKKSGMDKLIALNTVARNLCTIVMFSQMRPTSKGGSYAKGAAIAGTLFHNVLDFLLRTTRAIDERFLE